MYYVESEYAGFSYRVVVFPHPTRAGYFSYHSEINGAPVLNPVYSDRGTSIGAYGSQGSALSSGVFHTLEQIQEAQNDQSVH